MLQNAYLFAKFGADTAENEPHFVMKDWQEGRGGLRRHAGRRRGPRGAAAGRARGAGSGAAPRSSHGFLFAAYQEADSSGTLC